MGYIDENFNAATKRQYFNYVGLLASFFAWMVFAALIRLTAVPAFIGMLALAVLMTGAAVSMRVQARFIENPVVRRNGRIWGTVYLSTSLILVLALSAALIRIG